MTQVHVNNGVCDTLCGLDTANMTDMTWVRDADIKKITCQACLAEFAKIGASRTKRGFMTITGHEAGQQMA